MTFFVSAIIFHHTTFVSPHQYLVIYIMEALKIKRNQLSYYLSLNG